jgi:hypothetical protein
MTATLFEKYEIHRKMYKPGTIWKDKGKHIVKELRVLSDIDVTQSQVTDLGFWGHSLNPTDQSKSVVFVVTKSQDRRGRLSEGKFVRWSKSYMEDCYDPVR